MSLRYNTTIGSQFDTIDTMCHNVVAWLYPAEYLHPASVACTYLYLYFFKTVIAYHTIDKKRLCSSVRASTGNVNTFWRG